MNTRQISACEVDTFRENVVMIRSSCVCPFVPLRRYRYPQFLMDRPGIRPVMRMASGAPEKQSHVTSDWRNNIVMHDDEVMHNLFVC